MKYKIAIDRKTFTKMFEEQLQNDLYRIIDNWCDQNCKGKWSWLEATMWGFELEEDAMAFKLRWM